MKKYNTTKDHIALGRTKHLLEAGYTISEISKTLGLPIETILDFEDIIKRAKATIERVENSMRAL